MTPQQMLRALMAADAGETAPVKPALMDVALRDEAEFYTRTNPFRLGDLIAPRKGSVIRDAGEPGMVVAVRKDGEYNFSAGDPGSTDFGVRYDIRVLRWREGRWFAVWSESSFYEPWTPAEAETAAVDAAEAA